MAIRDIKEFNEKNFNEILREYDTYRKSYGTLTANMCHLPVVKRGFIISGNIRDGAMAYLKEKYGDIIMCRADAPYTAWYKIPRGRDIRIEALEEHYERLSHSFSNIILLCFQHPSIYFTGNFIERWGISGGVNILIIWGEQITIDCVGKGFDVGDLTRGIMSPHQSYVIPWSIRNHSLQVIWETINKQHIDNKEYCFMREIRVKVLQNMGYEEKCLRKYIPDSYCSLSYADFKELYRSCVSPVLYKKNLFIDEKPITILVNRYGEAYHVFEIWESNT